MASFIQLTNLSKHEVWVNVDHIVSVTRDVPSEHALIELEVGVLVVLQSVSRVMHRIEVTQGL